MKKSVLSILSVLLLSVPTNSWAKTTMNKNPSSKKPRTTESVRSEAGLNIPEWGIAIDAFFDARLTDLIPGYHIVNIVLTNRSSQPVMLDPTQDRWVIMDNSGKKHTARNHIQQLGDKIWENLPEPLRQRLNYPVSVKAGKLATIDVFIPNDVNLENFREIIWKSKHFSKEFSIYTSTEGHVNIASENSEPAAVTAEEQLAPFSNDDYLKSRDQILNPTAQNSDRWEKEEEEREKKKLEESMNFDPSFDDAIIIR